MQLLDPLGPPTPLRSPERLNWFDFRGELGKFLTSKAIWIDQVTNDFITGLRANDSRVVDLFASERCFINTFADGLLMLPSFAQCFDAAAVSSKQHEQKARELAKLVFWSCKDA